MVSLVAIPYVDVVDRRQHHVDHAAANSISSRELWRVDDSLWHSHIDRGQPVVFFNQGRGDAPVSRREVLLEITSSDGASKGVGKILASPGNQTQLQVGAEKWSVQVASIDPNWKNANGGRVG